MKILIWLIAGIFTLQATAQNKNSVAAAKHEFLIKGKIKGKTSPYLFLDYSNNEGKWVRDSAIVKHGEFEFKGKIKHPSIAMLGIDVISLDDSNSVSLFLEPTVMSLELRANDFKNAKLIGSKSHL